MKVLLLTDSDVFAGTERHMLELARGLRDEGVEARIACPSSGVLAGRARLEAVEVVPVEKRGLLDWRAVRRMVGLLNDREIDLVHSHNGRTAMLAAVAARLAKRGTCVTTQHFLEPSRVGRRGIKGVLSSALHSWAGRHTGRVIAISDAVRDAAVARGDVEPGRITVVPNGIREPELPTSQQRLRAELGANDGAPLVVCVARLQREKDVGTLIRAMRTVARDVPGVVCAIAGDGEEAAQLRSSIASEGLDGTVRLLGFRPDATGLIAAGDVFVLPSRAEPFGLVLLEAMALGKPVIATRAGGPLEIVLEGETGRLIPPSDPPQLAAALTALLRDPVVRERMGARGRVRWSEKFTAARMARDTLHVYERAMSYGSAAAGPPRATATPG